MVDITPRSLTQAVLELEVAGAKVGGLLEELLSAPVGTLEQGKTPGGKKWILRKVGTTTFDVEIDRQMFRFGP